MSRFVAITLWYAIDDLMPRGSFKYVNDTTPRYTICHPADVYMLGSHAKQIILNEVNHANT